MTTKIPVELSSTPGIVDSSNATAITIDSSENVMVGATSYNNDNAGIGLGSSGFFYATRSGTLVASFNRLSSDGTVIDFRNDSTVVGGIGVASSDLTFETNSSERIRISSAGNVGIGTNAPANLLHIETTVDGSGLTIQRSSTTAGTYSQLSFINTTTDNYTPPTWIRAYRNAAGVNAGEMTFGTAGSERMRIRGTNGDILLCKTVDTFSTAGIQIQQSTGRSLHTVSADNVMDLNRTTSHGVILGFYLNGSSVGTISTNANNLPSDRNFKRDISDLDLGLNLVTKLKPSQYNYKIDSEDCPKMYGLIAQDLEQALEEEGVEKNSTWLLQHEPKDDENQSDYALDYQKLTPILIKAIQEQQAIIEDLQTQINEVKNGN
tara:strand:- start:155 stop:1288 length:1134 start_codon:yes stop_codon:yes gene_type:complete